VLGQFQADPLRRSLTLLATASAASRDEAWHRDGGETAEARNRRRYEAARRAVARAGFEALEALELLVRRGALPAAKLPALQTAAGVLCRHLGIGSPGR
jgi:hypothetical protein